MQIGAEPLCKGAKVKSEIGLGLGLDHDSVVDRLISWPVGKNEADELAGWQVDRGQGG